jgi:hypothetical protein
MSDTANTAAIQLSQDKTKDSITEYHVTFIVSLSILSKRCIKFMRWSYISLSAFYFTESNDWILAHLTFVYTLKHT